MGLRMPASLLMKPTVEELASNPDAGGTHTAPGSSDLPSPTPDQAGLSLPGMHRTKTNPSSDRWIHGESRRG